MEAGEVLIVRGPPGAGKSTFLHVLYGDLLPLTGDIFLDNLPLASIDQLWWRAQVSYRNQGHAVFPGTLRDAFQHRVPDITDERIVTCLRDVGLGFLYETVPSLLDEDSSSSHFSAHNDFKGLLKLALSIANAGNIIILDDPSATLGAVARNSLYKLLNCLAENGKTIICATDDPEIIKGGTQFLDLGQIEEKEGTKNHRT